MILRRPYSLLGDLQGLLANPVFLLGASALISASYYLGELTLPYSLVEWWRSRHVSVRSMIGHNPGPQSAYVLTFVILFFLYLIALWMAYIRSDRRMWVLVVIGAVAFNLILLLQYPFDAIDIFDYIFRGRMQVVYGANPFYDIPYRFQNDTLYPYALWVHSTSAYGPLWEMIAAITSMFTGGDIITNVIGYKLVAIGGYAITCLMIALTLGRLAPKRVLFGVVLFAWNPLVLFSIAGGGHNDAVMAAFMTMGFYFLALRKFTLAALAETVGMLVKFIPALLLPIVIVAALRALPDWKARSRYLLVTGVACALLVALIYLPYWQGGDMLAMDRRTTLFTTSIPTLVRFFLSQSLGSQADRLVAYGALAATALFVIWQTWRVWRGTGDDAPARAGLSVLLFYLLIACLWFQPWYLVWVMALAPLVFTWTPVWGSVLFSAAAFAQLPLFNFILFPGHPLYPKPFTDLYEASATLGVCWLYFTLAGIFHLIHRPEHQHRVVPAETE